jgi:hypothetical protein
MFAMMRAGDTTLAIHLKSDSYSEFLWLRSSESPRTDDCTAIPDFGTKLRLTRAKSHKFRQIFAINDARFSGKTLQASLEWF